MSQSTNIFVYLGAKENGEKVLDLIQTEAKRRGFIKKDGQANVSPFVVHCIKYAIEHEA